MPDRDFVPGNVPIVGVKVKSIRRMNKLEDVYCLAAQNNGNMIANGIIVKNCDALRYILATHKVTSFDANEYYRKQQQQMKQDAWNNTGFR